MTTATLDVVAPGGSAAPPETTSVLVGDLKAGAFSVAKRDFKNSAEAIDIINFLDFLAQNNSVSADDLPLPYEKGKSGQEWKLSRADATRLFFGHIEANADKAKQNIKPIDEAAKAAIAKAIKERNGNALRTMESKVKSEIEQADAHMRELVNRLRNARKCQEDVDNMKGQDFATRTLELCNKLGETNWNFHVFANGWLEFVSRTDVILRHIEEKAGLRYELNCGKFRARFNMADMQVNVVGLERTVPRGHIHPHVNQGGSVCFGNGADAYHQAVVSGDFIVVLKLLDNMLPHYNSASPYISIVSFKAALDERDRLEREAHAKKEKAKAAGIPEGASIDDEEILDDDPDFVDDIEWSDGEADAEGGDDE